MSNEVTKRYKDLTDEEKVELIMDSRNINMRLQDIENTIKRIELALIGNQSLGQKGLVERISALEIEVESHKLKLIKWGGIITGGVFVLQIIVDHIIKLIHP